MNLSHSETRVQIGRVIRNMASARLPAVAQSHECAAKTEREVAESFERGRAQGRDEARAELQQQLAATAKLAESVRQQQQEMARAMDRFATQLSVRIASKIIDREVANPDVLKETIAAALAQVPAMNKLTLRVHPQDAALLSPAMTLAKGTALPADVTIVADASMRRGGCIIDDVSGRLDARMETQLELVERALLV